MIILRDVIFDQASKWNWPDDLAELTSQENCQIQAIRENRLLDLGPSSSIRPSLSESSSLSTTLESSPSQSIWRSQRKRHPTSYLQDYECGQVITAFFASKPQTFQDAAQDEKWIEAMNEEIRMIEKNNT